MSYQEKIRAMFLEKVAFNEAELSHLEEKWSFHKQVAKNDYLSKEGETGQYLYFVIEGVMRIFYLYDGEEICIGFSYDDTIICSYPSFISNHPSEYYIQALTDLKLVGINRKDFYEFMDTSSNMERCWRMFTEEALLGKIKRETEMLTFTPEERYERLSKRSPHLFQLVPQKYIASYLGMKPETLSRVKRKHQLKQKS